MARTGKVHTFSSKALTTALLLTTVLLTITCENSYGKIPNYNLQEHTNLVGFTAFKQSTQLVSIGDTVQFDGVLLNEGGHYDPSTSSFTCPYDGVYFVSLNLQVNGFSYVDVVKEDQVAVYTYSFGISTETVSNAGMIECFEGESMSVTVSSGTNVTISGDSGTPKTTFSVWMIYENTNGTYVKSTQADQRHQESVGFSVRKTTSQSVLPSDTISFDEITYNPGNDFNTSLNAFICPSNGIYYTYLTTWKVGSTDVYTAIEKSGINQLHIEDSQGPQNQWNTMSNSYVSYCEAGEIIVVKATESGAVHGETRSKVSSFLGVLMFATDIPDTSTGVSQHNSFIGFTAFKKYDQIYVLDDGIAFDGVMLNVGGHYDAVLSQFTCPFDAVYYISVTVVKLATNSLMLDVQRDTISVLRFEDFQTSNPYKTITNNVLVRCFQGQHILVKATGSGAVQGDPNKALTTFTVMMMAAD